MRSAVRIGARARCFRAHGRYALADAAKGGYTAWQASYNAGTATASECYLWSRRWAEAEQALAANQADQIAALRGHRDRMEQLLRKIDALHREGVRGGEEERFYSAKFYLAEAEVWLAQATQVR